MTRTQQNAFTETLLPTQHDSIAPDGSQVRQLLRLTGGSMAHFELGAGEVSRPQRHRTVSEIWYVIQGPGADVAPPGRGRASGDRSAARNRLDDSSRHIVPVPQYWT